MDKYGIDKSALVYEYNDNYVGSIVEAQPASFENYHDANLREAITRALCEGFLAYTEIISGKKPYENLFFEVTLPREALKIVYAYHEAVVGSRIFGDQKPKDFYDFAEESFNLDRYEMCFEGALLDLAYHVYMYYYEDDIYSFQWLINSIDS